jgi:thymidylate synthase (FAD)
MSVELIDVMGDESRIVDAAQVSTKGAFRPDKVKAPGLRNWLRRTLHTGGWALAAKTNGKFNPGLVKWLYKERHASPFEHCVMTFRIEAPIFITREILRHRISSFNEESGRYRVLKGVFYTPKAGRALTQVGKVGNYQFEAGTAFQRRLTWLSTRLAPQFAWVAYRAMIKAGVAREVARMVLPVSLYSSLYYTANLRSLLNFVSLRVDWGDAAATRSHPQAEIQEIGLKIGAAIAGQYPNVWKSFTENGYRAV